MSLYRIFIQVSLMLISIIFISGVLINGEFDLWIQQKDNFDSNNRPSTDTETGGTEVGGQKITPDKDDSAYLSDRISGKGVVLKDSAEPQTSFLSQAFAENDVLTFQSTVKSPQGDLTRCHGNIILSPIICVGTIKNDTIVGTVAGGTIYGDDGNDKIQGLLAQQVIFGNNGNDTIQGGNSTNAIFGNNGNDTIVAGSGFDPLKGGAGSMLVGGNGDDKILGGPDHDILEGGAGHDLFQCNGKVDLVLDFNPDEDQAVDNCIFK